MSGPKKSFIDPEVIERAQHATQALEAQLDKLNERLTEIEKHFRWLKLPHTVSVAYDRYEDQWQVLAFIRFDDKRQLCHATVTERFDGEEEWSDLKPLSECSAEIRVHALRHVRELHKEAIESKERYVAEVADLVDDLSDFCCEV